MTREIRPIVPSSALPPSGPYVHVNACAGFLWTQAVLPLDLSTMKLVGGSTADQTRQLYRNLELILSEASSGLDKIIKMNVYLTDFDQLEEFTAVSSELLGGSYPARATIKVAGLHRDALIALDVVAATARQDPFQCC